MSFKSKSLSSILCAAVLTMATSNALAQDQGAIPGIKPAVIATDMSDEEMMKTFSLLLVYNQLAQMKMQLKGDGFELDEKMALEGARRLFEGEEVGVPMEKIQMVMSEMQKKVMAVRQKKQQEMKVKQEEMMAQMKELAAKNEAEGKAYLAENAKKEGVVTLDGGVQYEVMVEGTGPKPQPNDKVKINYHGMFIDGTVFDSTIESTRGEPVEPYVAPANIFVEGFTAALQAMPVGSKWRVSIPSDKAYKMGGRGMPPNKTLIFELELLEIVSDSADGSDG